MQDKNAFFWLSISPVSHYIIIIIIIVIIIITIELTHSKTILEVNVEMEPQTVALDFKNLPQDSSHSK